MSLIPFRILHPSGCQQQSAGAGCSSSCDSGCSDPQLAGVRLNSVSTHEEENHRRFPAHTAAKHRPSFYWKFPSGQEPATSLEKHSVLPLVRLGSTAQRHPQLGWMFRSYLGRKPSALLGSEGSPQPLGWGGRDGCSITTTGEAARSSEVVLGCSTMPQCHLHFLSSTAEMWACTGDAE